MCIEVYIAYLNNSCTKGEYSEIESLHLVVSEHPEVIEVRGRLIYVDFLDSEKAAEDFSIDYDGDASDE